ncbi:MAG: OsmC family protein [Geminicoccaceae bacterium]
MAHRFKARIVWTGASDGPAVSYDGYSREHLIEIDGKPPLRGSSAPAFRGNPGLHNPEDLLVASISACHMLWYLHLCTDAGIHVSAYADDPEGTMDLRDGKMVFTGVVLRPRVTIIEGDASEALALHRDANSACFIANSMSFPVHHEPEIERV